ncbi:MAG: CCRG-2 family RiPP [Cyanobacteria bacterium P01_B01_bin.77]
MTTQTMNNELTLDQLDTVSGGHPVVVAAGAAGVVVGAAAAVGVAAVGAAVGLGLGMAISGVKADDEGNGDYRRGPDTSNSPNNPFG